jgi:hypothetical protein
MGPGGSTALSATDPPCASRAGTPALACHHARSPGVTPAHAPTPLPTLPGGNGAHQTPAAATLGHEHGSAPVGRPPSTCRLATTSSRWGLSPHRVGGVVLGRGSHLDAFSGSPVRTELPGTARCHTTGTPAVRPARSSRTRASPPHSPMHSRRIETELSHDVLNPARVPLSWANSPTLGTFSSPRMRRADIEVPNPAVDVDSWAGSACYPRGSFYPLSHGPSTRHRGITRPDFRPCSARPPRSQAPLLPLRAPADCHPA